MFQPYLSDTPMVCLPGGRASHSLWSWGPGARLSLLRSSAKVALPSGVHSLHSASSAAGVRPNGDQAPPAPANGSQQEHQAAAAARKTVPETEPELATPLPGVLVVFSDGSVAQTSLLGDELRLGPVTASFGAASRDGEVCAPAPNRSHMRRPACGTLASRKWHVSGKLAAKVAYRSGLHGCAP